MTPLREKSTGIAVIVKTLGISTFTSAPARTVRLGALQVIGTPLLRTLDAIHLATAAAIAEELEGFLTYDKRLAEAAEALGFEVFAPA